MHLSKKISVFFVLAALVVFAFPAYAQEQNPLITEAMELVEPSRLDDDARILTGMDPYKGELIISRQIRHPDHDRALEYLGQVMTAHGYQAKGELFSCNAMDCYNLVLEIPGAVNPDIIWVMGAHWDSFQGVSGPAPGAVDNASGVIIVLETLRILAEYEFEDTLRFVLFDAEEEGLKGSRHHAQDSSSRGDNIQLMYNLDIPGWRLPGINAALSSSDHASWPLLQEMNRIAMDYPSGTAHIGVPWEDNASSNHSSFWNEGYKAFILGSAYALSGHMHSDDHYGRLDLEQCENVTRLSIAYLSEMAGILGPAPPVDNDDDDDDDFVADDDDDDDDDDFIESGATGDDDDDDSEGCCG